MLDVFRQKSRSTLIYVLFGVIILAFIFTFNTASRVSRSGGLGGDTTEAMADVAGTTIDNHELSLAMLLSADAPQPGASGFEKMQAAQRYEKTRMLFSGVAPELAMLTPFDGPVPPLKAEKVLTELTESVLVAKAAADQGLAVSDAELSRRVMALQRIFGSSLVDENGQFDPRKYDVFVRFTLGSSKAALEQFLRREILRDKLAAIVTAGITIAPAELDALVAADSKRPHLEFVALDADTAAHAVAVSDADADAYAAAHADKIQAAYDAKGEQYKSPEKYNVRGILVAAPARDAAETDEAKKKDLDEKWAEKKKAAEELRADLDKAWKGDKPLDPIAPPKVEGQDAPAVAADGKTAKDLAAPEKTARLLQLFSKVAGEKTEHSITKDAGGKFVDDLSAEGLKRTPFGPAVATAVAAAPVDTLVGPVEGSQGWWVLVVEKKLPPTVTPLASVSRELAKSLLQQERAGAELDQIAQSLLDAAKKAPTQPLADTVKAWNKTRTGKDDSGLTAAESGPLGKSPVAALQGGIEAMLGMPAPSEDPNDIPGMGKLPEAAKAAWKLTPEAPVAGQVFKSEDGKTRYVARLAPDKKDAKKDKAEGDKDADKEAAAADAKVRDSLGKIVLSVEKAEAWRGYVRKLLLTAEAAGKIKRTEAFATVVQQEKDRLAAAQKRAPKAESGASPFQIKVGDQEMPVEPQGKEPAKPAK